MPNWAQEILNNHPWLAGAVGLAAGCYGVFAWVEDRLSANAREEISVWLKSAGDFAASHTLSFNLSHFHSQLFGDKQFSAKCWIRTLFFSFFSFFLIFLPIFAELGLYVFKYNKLPFSITMGSSQFTLLNSSIGTFQVVLIIFIYSLLIFTLIVMPLDFAGVGVTRKLAMTVKNDISLKRGFFIFTLDTLTKAVIFPFICVISSVVIYGIVIITLTFMTHIDLINIARSEIKLEKLLNTEELTSIISSMFSFFVYLSPCFLLCSAWVWLYLVGLHVVRRGVFLFDVDKQPVRSIGIIGAAVLTGWYGLYTTIQPSLRFGYESSSDDIAVLYQGDYDRAITDYSEAIKLDPKAAPAFSNRGLAYAGKQDYDRAITDYSEAIRLDPEVCPCVFNNRGLAYYAAKRDYDHAIADYNEAIRLDPKFAGALTNRGNAYAAKQDYDRAIADYSEAIRLDPKFAPAFFNRGLAYAAKQDFGRAIVDYDEAIRIASKFARAIVNEAFPLDPRVAGFFYNRGLAYAARQDYDRVIADYSEAIRLDAKHAGAFYGLGMAHAAKQDYDRAIADFNEAIRLDPKVAGGFYSRGLAFAAKQDYDRAIADFNEAIRLDPKLAVAFFNRGFAYAAKQDYDRAIADFNEAIGLDPKVAGAFFNRGLAFAAKQDYGRAIADYNEAIRLEPRFPVVFFNRGRAYAAKQDYGRAIADYNEEIRLDPKSAPAYLIRGITYAAKQDYDRAIADYNEAIRLDPKFAYPVLWLYLARARSGAQTAAAELEINAKNLKQPDWPYPVVELFLGRRTPEATLAAPTKPEDRCEAQFYVAEWRLSRGNRRAAMAALKAAAETCPKTPPEYELARAELQRLRR